MIFNVPVPIMYDGVFYEVDVIKSMTNVNDTQIQEMIKNNINKLEIINQDEVSKKIMEQVTKLMKDKASKEELENLKKKINEQINDVNNKMKNIENKFKQFKEDINKKINEFSEIKVDGKGSEEVNIEKMVEQVKDKVI